MTKIETPLVKELRDQAARETKTADNPFEARTHRAEWRAAAEIERLAIQPQRMPVAWRWRHVNDPNFAWHYQETAIGNANEYLQVEPLYALTRPECGNTPEGK